MNTTETYTAQSAAPSPADVAATAEPLSARGLAALYSIETELAWGEL